MNVLDLQNVNLSKELKNRDIIIDMLKSQLKKLEEFYIKSLDESEKVRFRYGTVVQALSKLKQIHCKVVEENEKLTKINVNKKEVIKIEMNKKWEKQCEHIFKALENFNTQKRNHKSARAVLLDNTLMKNKEIKIIELCGRCEQKYYPEDNFTKFNKLKITTFPPICFVDKVLYDTLVQTNESNQKELCENHSQTIDQELECTVISKKHKGIQSVARKTTFLEITSINPTPGFYKTYNDQINQTNIHKQTKNITSISQKPVSNKSYGDQMNQTNIPKQTKIKTSINQTPDFNKSYGDQINQTIIHKKIKNTTSMGQTPDSNKSYSDQINQINISKQTKNTTSINQTPDSNKSYDNQINQSNVHGHEQNKHNKSNFIQYNIVQNSRSVCKIDFRQPKRPMSIKLKSANDMCKPCCSDIIKLHEDISEIKVTIKHIESEQLEEREWHDKIINKLDSESSKLSILDRTISLDIENKVKCECNELKTPKLSDKAKEKNIRDNLIENYEKVLMKYMVVPKYVNKIVNTKKNDIPNNRQESKIRFKIQKNDVIPESNETPPEFCYIKEHLITKHDKVMIDFLHPMQYVHKKKVNVPWPTTKHTNPSKEYFMTNHIQKNQNPVFINYPDATFNFLNSEVKERCTSCFELLPCNCNRNEQKVITENYIKENLLPEYRGTSTEYFHQLQYPKDKMKRGCPSKLRMLISESKNVGPSDFSANFVRRNINGNNERLLIDYPHAQLYINEVQIPQCSTPPAFDFKDNLHPKSNKRLLIDFPRSKNYVHELQKPDSNILAPKQTNLFNSKNVASECSTEDLELYIKKNLVKKDEKLTLMKFPLAIKEWLEITNANKNIKDAPTFQKRDPEPTFVQKPINLCCVKNVACECDPKDFKHHIRDNLIKAKDEVLFKCLQPTHQGFKVENVDKDVLRLEDWMEQNNKIQELMLAKGGKGRTREELIALGICPNGCCEEVGCDCEPEIVETDNQITIVCNVPPQECFLTFSKIKKPLRVIRYKVCTPSKKYLFRKLSFKKVSRQKSVSNYVKNKCLTTRFKVLTPRTKYLSRKPKARKVSKHFVVRNFIPKKCLKRMKIKTQKLKNFGFSSASPMYVTKNKIKKLRSQKEKHVRLTDTLRYRLNQDRKSPLFGVDSMVHWCRYYNHRNVYQQLQSKPKSFEIFSKPKIKKPDWYVYLEYWRKHPEEKRHYDLKPNSNIEFSNKLDKLCDKMEEFKNKSKKEVGKHRRSSVLTFDNKDDSIGEAYGKPRKAGTYSERYTNDKGLIVGIDSRTGVSYKTDKAYDLLTKNKGYQPTDGPSNKQFGPKIFGPSHDERNKYLKEGLSDFKTDKDSDLLAYSKVDKSSVKSFESAKEGLQGLQAKNKEIDTGRSGFRVIEPKIKITDSKYSKSEREAEFLEIDRNQRVGFSDIKKFQEDSMSPADSSNYSTSRVSKVKQLQGDGSSYNVFLGKESSKVLSKMDKRIPKIPGAIPTKPFFGPMEYKYLNPESIDCKQCRCKIRDYRPLPKRDEIRKYNPKDKAFNLF